MSRRARMAALYVTFAILSAAANFAVQQLSLTVYRGWGALGLSVLMGTGVGFVIKYALDRIFVFEDRAAMAMLHEARKVVLYGLTAVITTLIFWTMEFGFLAVGKTAAWKYAGGALGLAMGYGVKFLLDRRWVFQRPAPP